MKTSKFLLSTLVAAAAMTSSAYAETLGDAILSIDSFTTGNISALTNAGWTFSNITGTDDGTYTTTGTQGTISITGKALTTNVPSINPNGTTTDRFTYSAIVTVDASVFTGSGKTGTLVGNAATGGGVGLAVNNGTAAGAYKNTYWSSTSNGSIAYDPSFANSDGTVTLGISFLGGGGTTIYMGGESTTIGGLKDAQTLASVGLSTLSGVTYHNLYWFNKALDSPSMNLAMRQVKGTVTTWAGTAESNSWNSSARVWDNGVAYDNTKSALFDSSATSKTVTVDGSVNAGDVFITSDYSFSLENNTDSLSITNLNVLSGATTFSGKGAMTITTLNASGGTVNISGTGTNTLETVNVSGGTANISGTGTNTLGTVNVSGGTTTISGTGTNKIGTLSHRGGSTVFESDVTITGFRFDSSGSVNGSSTIKEGVTVNATTFHNSWGFNTLTVNGTLNVTGDMNLVSGTENKVVGSGTINVNHLDAGNAGTYTFSGVTLNIGTGSITGDRPLTFGEMTIGVRDGASSWTAARGFAIGSTEGTTFQTDEGESISVGGVVSGVGKLIKDGAGTLTLSGTNTYTGGTMISVGTLIAGNAKALGTEAVTVSGGQLSIGENVTIENDIGIILSDVYKASAAIIGTGALAGNIDVSVADWDALNMLVSYKLWDAETLSSVEGVEVTLDGLDTTKWDYSVTDGLLTFSAIPEPSAFGLLAGVGALALVAARRRRRK